MLLRSMYRQCRVRPGRLDVSGTGRRRSSETSIFLKNFWPPALPGPFRETLGMGLNVPSSYRNCSCTRLGVDDVKASFAWPRHVPLDVSLAAGSRVSVMPHSALLAECPRARARRAAARRRVLRVRRDVRDQERRHVECNARRQVRRDRVDGRESLHRARQLVPAADRRRPLAPRCQLSARPPRTRSSPCDRDLPSPKPHASSLRTPQLRANLREGDRHHSQQSARRSSKSSPTGRRSGTPAARSRRMWSPNLDRYLLQFEAAVQGAGGHVHWARDANEANAVVAGDRSLAPASRRSSRSSRSRPTRSN